MSADNGIYILETPSKKVGEFEYRVAELMAIENMCWHWCSKHGDDYHFGNDGKPDCAECHTGECSHDECHIKHARKMWGKSKVFHAEADALIEAGKILKKIEESDFPICEYGISFIRIPLEF